MRRIIKPGKDLKKEHLIYTTTCPVCGCVFEFEDEDCLRIERCLNGRVTIACPHCNAEFKVRRSECESRTESMDVDPHKYEAISPDIQPDIVPNPCATCSYKDKGVLDSKCESCVYFGFRGL